MVDTFVALTNFPVSAPIRLSFGAGHAFLFGNSAARIEMAHPTVFVVDTDDSVHELVASVAMSHGLASEGFSSADQFLAVHDGLQPGCLVLDMPDADGRGIPKQLTSGESRLPFIVISSAATVGMVVAAFRGGAVDFFEKPLNVRSLEKAVVKAVRLDAEHRERNAAKSRGLAKLSLLSDKQREVAELLVHGVSNKEIAAQLGVAIRTVEDRRYRIMQKLKISSAVELCSVFHSASL